MWGIIPAAGAGTRIQPLAFSKELLPVGSSRDGDPERPCAVSDYLVERLILGGADRICFVISPAKSDILAYYGPKALSAYTCYVVQPRPVGLCDAIFRALPLIPPNDVVMVGLPDTIWFPENALRELPDDALSFLLFPVQQPQHFDAVVMDQNGNVREIQVKKQDATSSWIWGAFKMPASIFRDLFDLWTRRREADLYVGTLVNAYLAEGGAAQAICAGASYLDVGTLHGYREAIRILGQKTAAASGTGPA